MNRDFRAGQGEVTQGFMHVRVLHSEEQTAGAARGEFEG